MDFLLFLLLFFLLPIFFLYMFFKMIERRRKQDFIARRCMIGRTRSDDE